MSHKKAHKAQKRILNQNNFRDKLGVTIEVLKRILIAGIEGQLYAEKIFEI